MITLEQLLVIVPLSDAERRKIFTQVGKMNLAQRSMVYETCWNSLKKDFDSKFKVQAEEILQNRRLSEVAKEEDIQALAGSIIGKYVVKLAEVDKQVKRSETVAVQIFKDLIQRLILD